MKYLTTKQSAEILGVDDSRIRQLILAGRLKATKAGRDWLITSKALKAVKNRRPGRPKGRQS
jgi:excisionase family DNA binding protein